MNTVSIQNKATLRAVGGWALIWSIVLLAWSRFAGAPVVDFITDDWRMLELGRACTSFTDALASILRWPDRPLGTVALVYTFHVFDEWLAGYAWVGFLSGVLFMLFTMKLVAELTERPFVVFTAGAFFALLPMLTETFQWPTMVVYGPGFAAYPAAAWAGLRYLRTGRPGWLGGSVALYMFAMGTYEVGVALAPVFLAFFWSQPRRRIMTLVSLWGGVAVLYMAWKLTGCFGLAHDPLFPRREITLDKVPWLWSTMEAARWWMGSHAWSTLLDGWKSFETLPDQRQRMLLAGNVLITAIVLGQAARLHRREPVTADPPPPYHPGELLLFSLMWFGALNAVNLVSWSAGRLCLVPSIGIALVVGLVLQRLPRTAWLPVAALLMFLMLAANQGTSRQWQEAGAAHRAIFNLLRDRKVEWQDKALVYFDTRTVRMKQTGGLRGDAPTDEAFWGYYGNATLFRGFVFTSMIKQLAAPHPYPQVILDVEHQAEIDVREARWTGWYDASEHHVTPRDQVFHVDCLTAAHYQPAGSP